MNDQFKAGDGVTFSRYGVAIRATVVENPRGNVLIVREHESGRRSWCSVESATLVEPDDDDDAEPRCRIHGPRYRCPPGCEGDC